MPTAKVTEIRDVPLDIERVFHRSKPSLSLRGLQAPHHLLSVIILQKRMERQPRPPETGAFLLLAFFQQTARSLSFRPLGLNENVM